MAWSWVDVKCGHKLWARSTSSVSIEMTGRQEGLLHARPSLIQDGSHSQRSWHLMIMCLRRSLLVTTEQNICLYQLCEIPCIIFCLIELCPLPSACNVTFISDRSAKNWPSAYERRSFAFICSLWQWCLTALVYWNRPHQKKNNTGLLKLSIFAVLWRLGWGRSCNTIKSFDYFLKIYVYILIKTKSCGCENNDCVSVAKEDIECC